MSPLDFFEWCYATSIGETIRESTWLFPLIEAFHLVGLGLTVGAVLIVNLRLLGMGLNRQPVAELWAGVQPWLIGSLVLMFVSGTLLFLSESIKCYYNVAFWVKMGSLLLVLLLTFTVQRRLINTSAVHDRPLLARSVALVSLGLWFGVAWGGRWIGFS
jgi:hypothetical protein